MGHPPRCSYLGDVVWEILRLVKAASLGMTPMVVAPDVWIGTFFSVPSNRDPSTAKLLRDAKQFLAQDDSMRLAQLHSTGQPWAAVPTLSSQSF